MVNEVDDDRGSEFVPFALRMRRDLKTKVEQAARDNRRSANAEIIERVARSFGLDTTSQMPRAPIASETAKRALSKTEEHAAHLENHEKRLRKLEDLL
jgi:hypothetical protein